ncbi:MAG: DUF3352 domain-containing protein [Candidatus Aminicenantes bacterium]|nr:MAG: DUF3352 domain-containing protein [Candidatus Aminicenantes bacterium]
MKKTMTFGLALLLTAVFLSCTPAAGVKSGAAAGEALIKLLPKGTMGVMAVDIQRAMSTDATAKALQDPKSKEKYDEFVKMSGIDPMKDISYVAIGLSGMTAAAAQDGGIIVNLKYDKDRLQGLIKEKAPEATEELYNGVTVYANLDGDKAKQTTQAAFLDDAHIVLGSAKGVRGIIDVHQKKAESMAKNAEMAAILKNVDKSGFAWGAFAIPPELLKKGIEASPQLKGLEGIKAVTMAFDYKMTNFVADIRTLGGTKEQNTNLASMLNGFKAMGAMFAAEEPAVGELLNGITIGSGEDFTRLSINISQDVMDKLGKLAQSKAGDFMKPKKDEAPEVKK